MSKKLVNIFVEKLVDFFVEKNLSISLSKKTRRIDENNFKSQSHKKTFESAKISQIRHSILITQ
jgi:hypothetical protein